MSNTPTQGSAEQLRESQSSYRWDTSDDKFPPHVLDIPQDVNKSPLNIFNLSALLQTQGMMGPNEDMISTQYTRLAPGSQKSLDALVDYNQRQRPPSGVRNHMLFPFNISDRRSQDWYSDAVFAQQHFTGTNATTIKLAGVWKDRFDESAQQAQNEEVREILKNPDARLYVQDYSYFRSHMGITDEKKVLASGDGRYGVAPVALFQLGKDGILHPLAIVIDYKGSMAASVVIFNKRLTPSSDKLAEEAEDWPWRYAKTCVQCADWLRHEVSIHLVNTHLVEEAVIVAANRTLPRTHIVYELLYRHWETTLSLNKQARETLVPDVIAKIAPVRECELFNFLKKAYMTFDWTGLYVPEDLKNRGFSLDDLKKPEFHNYAYALNMALMWPTIRDFVAAVLTPWYKDKDVKDDEYIRDFCKEMRSPEAANMPSFPKIETLEHLIDTVTMCIHIASPQHTAVNYLQQYYQVFVPNKPWALYTSPPDSLAALQEYREQQLLDTLPFKHVKDWLIGAQLPYLLSFDVLSQSSLLSYATSQKTNVDKTIAAAAVSLEKDLIKLQEQFKAYSDALSDKETIYTVLDPAVTAVSILI